MPESYLDVGTQSPAHLDAIVDVLYPDRTGHARMPARVTVQTYFDFVAGEVRCSGERACIRRPASIATNIASSLISRD